MRTRPSIRRFILVIFAAATCSIVAASCAASGPKYGCPGAVNQGSKYANY